MWQTECRFESSASAEEAYERALPVIMKHWDKQGVVECWRIVKFETTCICLEALIVVIEPDAG